MYSELIQKDFFHKNFQIVAKYHKIVFFAANAITYCNHLIISWRETFLYLLHMKNHYCVPNLKVIYANYTICCKSNYFAAFCSNLIFFQKRDLSESTSHDNLFLCTKFRSNQCISSQIIPFAANHAFCSILQQPHDFFKRRPVWIYSTSQTTPLYQFRN